MPLVQATLEVPTEPSNQRTARLCWSGSSAPAESQVKCNQPSALQVCTGQAALKFRRASHSVLPVRPRVTMTITMTITVTSTVYNMASPLPLPSLPKPKPQAHQHTAQGSSHSTPLVHHHVKPLSKPPLQPLVLWMQDGTSTGTTLSQLHPAPQPTRPLHPHLPAQLPRAILRTRHRPSHRRALLSPTVRPARRQLSQPSRGRALYDREHVTPPAEGRRGRGRCVGSRSQPGMDDAQLALRCRQRESSH